MRNGKKRERTCITAGVITFNIVCEIVSLFIIGFDRAFLTGIVVGTAAVVINYNLLEIVVGSIVCENRTKLKICTGILIEVLRLIIFAVTIYVSVNTGMKAVIAYAVSILSFTPFAIFAFAKGDRHD